MFDLVNITIEFLDKISVEGESKFTLDSVIKNKFQNADG